MRHRITHAGARAPRTLRALAAQALLAFAAAAAAQAVVEHALDVTLAPAAGRIAVHDRVRLPPGGSGPLRFVLHAAFAASIEERGAQLVAAPMPPGAGPYRYYRLTLPAGTQRFTLRYEGRLTPDDTLATVSDEGVYLDDQSGWYPIFVDELVRLALTVHLPAGWQAVSQGRRRDDRATAAGRRVAWEERAPQQAIYLVAARFHRYRAKTDWGEALVYLRTPDARLAQTYLDATRKYIARYSRLLGPYPYTKFALVENFRQTGFGMPSFTLLGSRVIRLPFIPETSYPHEILHNWFGNGVYVDAAGGNWSEGLTSYLTDHLQAEEAGRGAAYRRDALARYASFVRRQNDFALQDFHGRHDEASQAVGYGKGLMFFHMLRLQLGDADFLAGLRALVAQQRFHRASFDALRAAFEQASGQRLGDFFQQWLTRTGAPQLRLEEVAVREVAGRARVVGTVEQTQPGPAYRLEVPLAIERAEAPPLETTLVMPARQLRFDIAVDGKPLRVALDPRFDVFRRLDPAEVPASFGEAFGAERVTLVLPAQAPEALRAAYAELARQWQRDGVSVRSDDALDALPTDGAVWLLGWENRWRAALVAAVAPEATLADDSVTLDGERFERHAYSIALAARRDGRTLAWLGTDTPDAIARLARVLPHYTGMSYAVFAGAAAEKKLAGQWQATDSPLVVPLAPGVTGPLRLPPRPALTAGDG